MKFKARIKIYKSFRFCVAIFLKKKKKKKSTNPAPKLYSKREKVAKPQRDPYHLPNENFNEITYEEFRD